MPEAASVTRLPQHTFAIMVHKLYRQRVIEFLSQRVHWTVDEVSDRHTCHCNVKVLHTQEISGVSRTRRGFVLLLIENIKCPLESLPPMARQNISWVARILYHSSEKRLIPRILREEEGFQVETSSLRVDVYPRNQTDELCFMLQASYADEMALLQPSDPYEGPILMTMSASKCSHRLTVISNQDSTYYWGLMTRHSKPDARVLDLKFNHEAADEIVVMSADPTGKDISENIERTVPLSRAYYKLEEVWRDYLQSYPSLKLQHGAGVDLGACPGGWTQVLVHKLSLQTVVAVDPGRPADRVRNLPQVIHIQSDIASATIAPYGPFSMLVCDASIVWNEIMNLITETLVSKCQWVLPSCCVITLKLPFKTLQSIERHVDAMKSSIPSLLTKMVNVMFPTDIEVQVDSQIVHLMANSPCERTLIAVFKEQGGYGLS